MLFHAVFNRILFLSRTAIRVGCDILRVLSGLLPRGFSAVGEATHHVARTLPWPLDRLLGLMAKLADGFAEGAEWLLEEVILRVVEGGAEIVFEYAAYVLNWLCWLLDWSIRWLPLLLSNKGIRGPMTIPIAVKIIQDNAGTNAMTPVAAQKLIDSANEVMAQSNLQFVHARDMESIQQHRFFRGVSAGPAGLIQRSFTWFSARAEPGCVTVFVVKEIEGASGCAYPGATWMAVDASATGCIIAHEIGHLSDIWRDSEAQGDLMSAPCGTVVLDRQIGMIRTSKFAIPPRLEDLI
jgi:hypothetical protein